MARPIARRLIWSIEAVFADGAPSIRTPARGDAMRLGPLDPRCASAAELTIQQHGTRTWRPDAQTWSRSNAIPFAPATILISGYRDAGLRDLVSTGRVAIQTSRDPVGAPIFYRDVPLMPSATEAGVIRPLAAAAVPLIAWRLRDVGEPGSKLLMEGLHSCANCHSFSATARLWESMWMARRTTRDSTPSPPSSPALRSATKT